QEGLEKRAAFDELLVATGRRPHTDGLDLAAAGVRTDRRGAIEVDNHLRTSQPHIYAVGDCNGGPQFTHWAKYEARVTMRNTLFVGADRHSTSVVPWVTF